MQAEAVYFTDATGRLQDLQETVAREMRIRRLLDLAYLGMQRPMVIFFWFLWLQLTLSVAYVKIVSQNMALWLMEIQNHGERQQKQKAQEEKAALKEKFEKEQQQAQEENAALKEKFEKERRELQKQIDDLMKKSHSKTDGSNNSDDHCKGGCGPSNTRCS